MSNSTCNPRKLPDLCDRFSHDTRRHVLKILFRLAIDTSLTANVAVSSELERAITTILEMEDHEEKDEDTVRSTICHNKPLAAQVHDACHSFCETVRDTAFQGRLLSHILPTSDKIALVRIRLAVSFLTQSSTPLVEPVEMVQDAKRITDVLLDGRFDVKRHKRGQGEYDYNELLAATALLNAAIDPWMPGQRFPDKAAERNFNKDIDVLAEQIKKIFSAIQDSGASHLRRTLAKAALEALHYRIVYSIRSKPPRKTWVLGNTEDEASGKRMRQWVGRGRGGASKEDGAEATRMDMNDTQIPIRENQTS